MVSTRKQARAAEVSERRKKAMQMRIAGVKLDAIAEALGYSSPQAASVDIQRALRQSKAAEELASEELLQLTIDRLERALQAIWPKVLNGDLKAVERAESLIWKHANLLGLDQLNRQGINDGDIASLLGTLLSSLQARHAEPVASAEVLDVAAIEAAEPAEYLAS
ncbi:hypothetical protein C1I98_20345 [Spongiactinospora gelatinilytica]|uniref:Uncharacterized protein n=1 Tax=Spongiactinospora gelatinilytica TaxID=2666298 RepID=A0A2W2FWU9_9ACTN|nr:hypothetical protein [Spongiactinospora gelatinilytica]PZG42016.1 hypothetical protein C1I98_20345 [Spongiactinospora gelatinilytica]